MNFSPLETQTSLTLSAAMSVLLISEGERGWASDQVGCSSEARNSRYKGRISLILFSFFFFYFLVFFLFNYGIFMFSSFSHMILPLECMHISPYCASKPKDFQSWKDSQCFHNNQWTFYVFLCSIPDWAWAWGEGRAGKLKGHKGKYMSSYKETKCSSCSAPAQGIFSFWKLSHAVLQLLDQALGWSTFRGLPVSVLLPPLLTGSVRANCPFTQNKIQFIGKQVLKLQHGYS